MEMEYRRNLQHSYLVVHTREKEKEFYSSKMITENRIPGLLVCEEKNIDDEILYYYDLTSKISLADRWGGGKAEGEEVLSVIYAFLRTIDNMEEYLLSTDSIYLKLEQIYGDADMEEIEFCYIPGEKWDMEQQFRELMEEILPLLDHRNQKAVVTIYGIYHSVVQDGVSAEGLREQIEKYGKKEKTAEEICRGQNLIYEDGEYSGRETELDSYERKQEQKKHEEALEAFFQDEESEEKEKTPVWITYIASGMFLYFLSGWFVWRNFPEEIWIWLITGGVVAAVFILGSIIYKKRKEKETDIEGEKEDIQNYIQSWEREEIFREEDNMTRILGNNGGREGFFLEEKYPRQDRRIVIEEKEIQFLGTLTEKADIILPSQAVSRLHGRIRMEGKCFYLRDMNSRNGTWVNGRLLEGEQEVKLEEGDEIQFADLIYRFRG